MAGFDGVDQLLAGDIEFRLGGDQLGFQRRLIATTGSGDLPLDAFDIRLQRSQGMKVGMLGRDGILDGLLLQIQCIQRGQLGLQSCQRLQHRAIGVLNVGQAGVTLLFDFADQLRLMLRNQTLGRSQIAEGAPRNQDAHQIRGTQQVLRVAFLEMARGPNHQDLVLALGGLGLVEQHQAAGHVVAIEQLARQHDDGLDQVGFDEAAADHVLGIGLLVLPIFFFGLFGLPTEQHTL